MKEDILKLLKENGGNVTKTARDLNMSRAAFRRKLDNLKAQQASTKMHSAEVKALQQQISSLQKEVLNSEFVRERVFKLSSVNTPPPKWLIDTSAAQHTTGVPTLFCSDWHWWEVVDPLQINGVNEYNKEIAARRARKLIEKTIRLLRNYLANPEYPGIIFALGGDMVSGDIHDELSVSNEGPIMPAVLDLFGVLSWCIKTLADEFGKVFVPCVTGNHGRNTQKIRAKGRAHTSFDWLLYMMLAKRFEDDPRVKFLIPEGPDAFYKVYGHAYLLTHGDQFRGGDGMIGCLGPLCVAPDTRVLKADMSYVRADELNIGDEIVGFDEEVAHGNRRKFRLAEITETAFVDLECYEVETSDGQKTIASLDHPWLTLSGCSHSWSKTRNLHIGSKILSLGKPWELDVSRDAGYLAGVLDGEGTLDSSGRLALAQQDNACLKEIFRILDDRNISYYVSENGARARGFEPVYQVRLFQGNGIDNKAKCRLSAWRLLGAIRPERLIAEQFKRSLEDVSVQVAGSVEVIGLKYVGTQRLAAFSTSSKTFIGNGMLMHNTRGDHKKRSRNGQIDMVYDTLLVGHWHQHISLRRLIVNGSLVGYNEYAYAGNFGFEPPQQALWITHPEKGITFSMPVDVSDSKPTAPAAWVSILE